MRTERKSRKPAQASGARRPLKLSAPHACLTLTLQRVRLPSRNQAHPARPPSFRRSVRCFPQAGPGLVVTLTGTAGGIQCSHLLLPIKLPRSLVPDPNRSAWRPGTVYARSHGEKLTFLSSQIHHLSTLVSGKKVTPRCSLTDRFIPTKKPQPLSLSEGVCLKGCSSVSGDSHGAA